MLCLQLRWWGWLSGLLLLSGLPVSGDSIGDFSFDYFILFPVRRGGFVLSGLI